MDIVWCRQNKAFRQCLRTQAVGIKAQLLALSEEMCSIEKLENLSFQARIVNELSQKQC